MHAQFCCFYWFNFWKEKNLVRKSRQEMSLDAKAIGLFVWKIIRFFACCTYKFVRKYPVLSGILIFLLFVYIWFPSFFYFLLYASPILVCTAIFIRFYWKTKHPKLQVIKKKEIDKIPSGDVNRLNEEKSCPAVIKPNGPSLRHQKSVRRNARKVILSFDENDSPNFLFSRSIHDILSDKSDLLREDSRLVSVVNGSSNVEHRESSSRNETENDQALHQRNSLFDKETSKPFSLPVDSFKGQSGKSPDDGCGKVGVKSLQEREIRNDGEVKEDRNKDNEKNLMDLGLTGMERNRRLESLMVKRRAREMFKMAIEKSLMDKGIVPNSQIAPILIVKNNILGGSSNPNEDGIPMPASAPSILLPTRNPFDLPYDPFEEKPNLTADSFQQEFMTANLKETLFCRHESFKHGPLFTFETSRDRNTHPFNPYYGAEKKLVEGPAVDELKTVPDDEGCHHQRNNSHGFGSEIDLIEVEKSNDEAMNSSEEKTEKIRETANDKTEIGESTRDLSGSEVMEIDSIKNNDSGYSTSTSSSDDSASGLDQTTKPLSLCSSQVRKAFNLSIPPKGKSVSKHPNDSNPSPRRAEFNLFYNSHKRHGHHTRNCSIASDLQVEVSEVGSPTLLSDGINSAIEGDSVTYDGDVERDVNSDGEELWGGSFNLSKETNREKLRELDDIVVEDSVAVKLSGLNKKLEEPIALISPPEQEAEQILNTTNALPSRLDTTEDGASSPTNINRETRDVVRIGEEDNKHGNIETSYESKRSTEPEEKMEEIQPSKYVEEDTHNLTKQGTGDAPNAVQSRDDMESVPDSLSNQNIAESNASGVEQRLESSSVVASNRRLAIEQTHQSSCASPRSVLPQNILADQIPISNVEQQRRTDLPQSVMEDIERNNSEDNQPNHNSTFNIPPITQQPAENSIDHSSSSCSAGTLEYSAEVDRVCNVNDSSTDKVTSGTTSAESVEDTEHESKILTEAEANAELSTSKGVSKSLNNTNNGGDIQTLSGQEHVSDALQSREDNLMADSESISSVDNNVTGTSEDHKIVMEALKLNEFEVKAVNTKENDSNEVAK